MVNGKIVLSSEYGMLFDFFTILNNSAETKDLGLFYGSYQRDVEPKILDAYSRLGEYIKNRNPLVRTFFFNTEGKGTLFSYLFKDLLLTANGIDDIIVGIEALDSEELTLKTISFFDSRNDFNDEFYLNLLGNSGILPDFLNGIDLEAECKWELLSFFKSPDSAVRALVAFVRGLYEEVKFEYSCLTEVSEKWNQECKKFLKTESFENMILDEEVLNEAFKDRQFAEINIIPTLFNPFRVDCIFNNRKVFVYIGHGYDSFANTTKIKLTDGYEYIFKAFTDTTRTSIIELLRNREYYNGEISRILNVPMSSLTHHMDILFQSGFVQKRVEGKRTYYKLNPQHFIYVSQILRKYCE